MGRTVMGAVLSLDGRIAGAGLLTLRQGAESV
jgi:hypothetical protein